MKLRLDQLLVDRGLAESRERAQRLIRAGLVVVGEQRIDKPGRMVATDAPIRLKGGDCPYVSRGGLKLEGALRRFGLTDLAGTVALDVGASTGGFSDCLLQHGASFVWAVDTGRGQLHERLRQDPRVRLREQSNARELTPAWLDNNQVALVVIDVSFIPLRLVLPPLAAILAPAGSMLALVKPQFEAGRGDVGSGGVVRSPPVHRRVLREVIAFAGGDGWRILGLMTASPPGPAGNREFFLWLDRASARPALDPPSIEMEIERVLAEVYNESHEPPPPGNTQ